MQTSAAGRKAITQREGNKLTAYKDSVGIWTIGVGHTSAAGAPKVTQGLKITAAQSDEILSRDLKLFEAAVFKAVKVPLSQNEFDALVSLAFNIGGKAFAGSSVVKKLNAGDRKGAADAILLWNKACGRIVKGLVSRRKDERTQFLRGSKAAPVHGIMAAIETPAEKMAISLGDKGPVVSELKRNLNTLGYGPLTEDDVYDEATKTEVEAFQAGHKDEENKPLKVDGKAGLRTSKAIQTALLAPKLKVAERSVPPAMKAEVKKKTGPFDQAGKWLAAVGIGGAGLADRAFGAEWQTVVAIGGLALVGLAIWGVVYLIRARLNRSVDQINAEAKQ